MIGRRSLVLMVLAVPLLVAGLAAGYVRLELAEPEPFADRAVDALRSEEVRAAIAEQVAIEIVERGSPDLVASRPLVLSAVEAVLEADEFERVLRRAVLAAHEVLLRGDRDVVVELEEASEVLVPAVESVSPEVAAQIPADVSPRIAEIRSSDVATWTLRVAQGAGAAALALLLAAVALLGLAVGLAPDRLRAIAAAGLALAVAGAAGLIAMTALRAQLLSHTDQLGVLSERDARAAAGAAWDALAGGLERWLLVMGTAGLAVVGGALLAEARIDRGAALRHVAEVVAGERLSRPGRLLRGLALAAVGAAILLRAEAAVAAVVILVGGTLVLLGLAEVLSLAGRPVRTTPAGQRRRHPVALAAGALALVAALAIGVAVLVRGGPPKPPEEAEITACNGLRVLCNRPLDQVVLPGTHNSMSAADRPGWFFANQIEPIPRQLEDGIRMLMIDAHYGVVDSQGRVRTDLRAEGTSRNRVARRLGVEGVRVAERLAGQLGLVPAEGEREIFLCHTLCELGAERMSSALDEIRGFLERNPAEVLVILVESSVDPRDIEREFEETDLEPYLATLPRDEALPTLREMIASGRRLIVFDQGDGGAAPWHHPGYLFVQATRARSLLRSRTACDPGRGTPESPLFLMNHWIDRFPPPASANADASQRRTLLRRVRSCRERHGRVPNMIAVDFYERGDVIAAARELNRSGAAAGM